MKRQIVAESCQPNASVSAVARRYRIASAVLFRWRRAAGVAPPIGVSFVSVQLAEAGSACLGGPDAQPGAAAGSPGLVEDPSCGVEIELVGGGRVRFDRAIDAATMRRVVAALEGAAP